MINLDEAIAHAKEVAEEKRVEATAITTGKEDYFFKNAKYTDCIKCASEHEQLALWLEELAEWRKLELICANKGVFVYMKIESEAENEK